MPSSRELRSKLLSQKLEFAAAAKMKSQQEQQQVQLTTTAIKRGDCLLTEKPFVYVLQSKYRKERCDNCLMVGKVLKCSNCQYVYYCNRACQMQAWSLHKIECPFLKRIYPRTVPDAGRMLCKLIIKLDKGGDLQRGFTTPTMSRRFRDMMSHYAEIKNDAKRLEHLESLHAILCEMMAGSAIVPNQTELMSIYGRLITNGFNILDGEMHSIATAIYLGVSVTDHSCKPNAVATFDGNTLNVRAIEEMPCLDWSKIFISYIELLSTPEQRRAELNTNYYFNCNCERCIDSKQETLEMNAAACPNKSCSAFVKISWHNCSRCGTGINPKYRTAFNEAMAFTKSNLELMKDMAYLDVCKVILKHHKDIVHPLNLWHIKTLDVAFEAAIEVGKWADALEYGNLLLPGFRKYYGSWNPLLGLLYLKIGKIQLYENILKEALHNCTEARKILVVTHGREHSIIREQLIPLLEQATTENSAA